MEYYPSIMLMFKDVILSVPLALSSPFRREFWVVVLPSPSFLGPHLLYEERNNRQIDGNMRKGEYEKRE